MSKIMLIIWLTSGQTLEPLPNHRMADCLMRKEAVLKSPVVEDAECLSQEELSKAINTLKRYCKNGKPCQGV